MPIDTELETMTVEDRKAFARIKKERLIQKILICQSGNEHTFETLGVKTLKQLEKIYDKVVH